MDFGAQGPFCWLYAVVLFSFKSKEWHINEYTLPPGGSVYVVLLLSVQFSEKWIHIDLCYKGVWTNKPTHTLSVSDSFWI